MDSDDKNNRKDLESQLEKFLDHSQFYLNRLPLLKSQLCDINHINQSNLYIEKLNEIDKIIHDLAETIRNIEQLHSQLNDIERSKLEQQIHLLRIEIDSEMTNLNTLREQITTEENTLSIDETDNMDNNLEDNSLSNELRQRHVSTNNLNSSYDLLQEDLVYLREAIDEVATLVAKQQQQIERIQQLRNNQHQSRFHNVSSFFQKAIHNQYVPVASGAVVGASVGGPVGFLMGTKVGALVALTGSALGALSVNIMQQKATETNESQTNDTITYNQAML